MKKTKVKICGIRTLEAAQVAVHAGVDFLGFNFVRSSKRYIQQEKAKEIILSLRAKQNNLNKTRSLRPFKSGDVYMVGVFQNQPVEEVNAIADLVGLDFIQLHGEEDNDYIQHVKRPVIKFLSLEKINKKESSRYQVAGSKYAKQKSIVHNTCYILLDREIQGKGSLVNVEKAKKIANQFDIFLAGGLTFENVAEIVAQVHPFAVDVASGVETDGKQDMEKISKFIANTKGVHL